jgi:hypothetical protein
MGYVRECFLKDVYELQNKLRQADQDELYASTGLDPKFVLKKSYGLSTEIFSIVCNCKKKERVVGIFGVVEHEGNGIIWMVASDLLVTKTHAKKFIKQTKQWVDILNDKYPLLFNVVDKRNKVHLRWLQWSGFTLIKEKPWGKFDLPFIEFARIKNV